MPPARCCISGARAAPNTQRLLQTNWGSKAALWATYQSQTRTWTTSPCTSGNIVVMCCHRMRAMHNKSANTDPHLHKAASPLKVVVRLPLR